MITLYTDKKDCCGCTACESICPNQAITMEPDIDGFLYPELAHSRCTSCGLCKKVCAFQSKLQSVKYPLATYAAVLKDAVILNNSASGGAFVALALYTLKSNGMVFGCAMNDEIKPEHIRISSSQDIKKLQGSKYVQSDLKSTFREAKCYVQEGRQVLFTGTPCQVAGLKAYLGKDYNNLITVDLICHGVPSPKFFKGYINWLEKELKGKVTDFSFRDKKNGWGLLGKAIYRKGNMIKETLIPPISSYYYNYFLKGDIYRKCCYECPYAQPARPGDFTIGDYWGIEKAHPEVNKQKGVSVVLVNDEKSMMILEKLEMNLIASSFELACAHNEQLYHPTAKSNRREQILKTFREEGFKAVADRYYNEMKSQILMYKIKNKLPQPVKKIIKKILGLG